MLLYSTFCSAKVRDLKNIKFREPNTTVQVPAFVDFEILFGNLPILNRECYALPITILIKALPTIRGFRAACKHLVRKILTLSGNYTENDEKQIVHLLIG